MRTTLTLLLGVLLLAGACAVPTASATTCHAGMEELEGPVCGAVLATICVVDRWDDGVKVIASCV